MKRSTYAAIIAVTLALITVFSSVGSAFASSPAMDQPTSGGAIDRDGRHQRSTGWVKPVGFTFAPGLARNMPTKPGVSDKRAAQLQLLESKKLAARFHRAQVVLHILKNRLDRAESFATFVQKYIDAENKAGHDTSSLQSALEAYKAAVETAATLNKTAADALSAPDSGFDANGKVTDAAKAKATLTAVEKAMRQSAETLQEARKDLRTALQEYRELVDDDSSKD